MISTQVDAFALAHVDHGLRYHAYNWTRSCPGADLAFPGASVPPASPDERARARGEDGFVRRYMLYSAGAGAQSFELGADSSDGSAFAADALWSLDPCAATYECRSLDDDDDSFDMAPFAVFLGKTLDLTYPSALALTIYFAASVSAVVFVVLASSRIKRSYELANPRTSPRGYRRIKDVVEI